MANAILKTLVTASAVHYLSPKAALGRSHFPATDPFADRLSKPLRDPWPRLGDSISSHVEAEVGTRCNSLAHLVGRSAHGLFDREKLRWRDELIVSRGQEKYWMT